MTRHDIPIIDLTPYFEGDQNDKRKVAADMNRACEGIGFFIITGHGVDPKLCRKVNAVSREFFDLPVEEKLIIGQTSDEANRGYEALGTEVLSATIGKMTPPDLKESFSLGPINVPNDPYYHSGAAAPHYADNMWPERPVGFRKIIEDYVKVMEKLARDLHRLAAIAFNLPEDFFEPKLDKPFYILRALNYPNQLDNPDTEQLRAGEHSDYDNLTICMIEDRPGGLQARNIEGIWINVPGVRDAFVVNIGDLMMRWTNDRWKSTRHRVVNPPRDLAFDSRRISMCFFAEPNYDAVIECLPTCHGTGEPIKYLPITAGDYMIEKFARQAQGKEWSEADRIRFDTSDTETRFID